MENNLCPFFPLQIPVDFEFLALTRYEFIVNPVITYTPKEGRGYNPRQRPWGSCSLTNCKHIFRFYYKKSILGCEEGWKERKTTRNSISAIFHPSTLPTFQPKQLGVWFTVEGKRRQHKFGGGVECLSDGCPKKLR